MNIWIEYFKYEDSRKNTWAQMRESAKWVEPDPKDVHKRFCQSREQAQTIANSLQEQGYHVTIKTDGVV
jgi:superfamily II DNA helicase RecQ|tara:strand:- start:1706 stop:1912 length:207 start_codon:yes stop_codon:yes gene_type:complete